MSDFEQKDRDVLGASWSRMIDCVTHDLKSPLASLRIIGETLMQMLPELFEGYQKAVAEKLISPKLNEMRLKMMASTLVPELKKTVDGMFDFLGLLHPYNQQLFSGAPEVQNFSIKAIIHASLEKYIFKDSSQRSLIKLEMSNDFKFHGAKIFFDYLLMHFFDNAFAAIEQAGKGGIIISTEVTEQFNLLHFKDTALGMDVAKLEFVFNRFFSKREGEIIPGLGFCRLALLQLGGSIVCESVKGEYTDFIVKFPKL